MQPYSSFFTLTSISSRVSFLVCSIFLPLRSSIRTRKLISARRSCLSMDFQMMLMPSWVTFFCSILKINSTTLKNKKNYRKTQLVSERSNTNKKTIVLFRMVIERGTVFCLINVWKSCIALFWSPASPISYSTLNKNTPFQKINLIYGSLIPALYRHHPSQQTCFF